MNIQIKTKPEKNLATAVIGKADPFRLFSSQVDVVKQFNTMHKKKELPAKQKKPFVIYLGNRQIHLLLLSKTPRSLPPKAFV